MFQSKSAKKTFQLDLKNIIRANFTLTAVTAENLFIDECNNWEAIETVCEGFPKFDIVATLT